MGTEAAAFAPRPSSYRKVRALERQVRQKLSESPARSATARKFLPYERTHSSRTELPFKMCNSLLPLFSTTLRNGLPRTSSTKWAAPTTFSSSPSSLSEAASLELLLLLLGESAVSGLSINCQLLLPGEAELSELAALGLCWSQRPVAAQARHSRHSRTSTQVRADSSQMILCRQQGVNGTCRKNGCGVVSAQYH